MLHRILSIKVLFGLSCPLGIQVRCNKFSVSWQTTSGRPQRLEQILVFEFTAPPFGESMNLQDKISSHTNHLRCTFILTSHKIYYFTVTGSLIKLFVWWSHTVNKNRVHCIVKYNIPNVPQHIPANVTGFHTYILHTVYILQKN